MYVLRKSSAVLSPKTWSPFTTNMGMRLRPLWDFMHLSNSQSPCTSDPRKTLGSFGCAHAGGLHTSSDVLDKKRQKGVRAMTFLLRPMLGSDSPQDLRDIHCLRGDCLCVTFVLLFFYFVSFSYHVAKVQSKSTGHLRQKNQNGPRAILPQQ